MSRLAARVTRGDAFSAHSKRSLFGPWLSPQRPQNASPDASPNTSPALTAPREAVTRCVTGDAFDGLRVTRGDAFSGFSSSRARAKQDHSKRVTLPKVVLSTGDAMTRFSSYQLHRARIEENRSPRHPSAIHTPVENPDGEAR